MKNAKKSLKRLAGLVCVLAGAMFANVFCAYGAEYHEEGNPYVYTYEVKEDETVMITEFSHIKSLGHSLENVQNCIIPSEIDGHPVTEIGENAYHGNDFWSEGGIRRLTIPASVKKIGAKALSLEAVEEVYMEEGVQEIGEKAFYNCMDTLKKVTLPRSLSYIAGDAFADSPQSSGSFFTCCFYTYKDSYAAAYLKENLKEYPYAYIGEYCKEADGFSVWTDDPVIGAEDVILKVEGVTEGTEYDRVTAGTDGVSALYRFVFEKNGEPVEPKGTYYRIQMPYYPAKEKIQYERIYQLGEDGSRTELEAEYLLPAPGSFGNYEFTVDELGTFLAVGAYRVGDVNGNGVLESEDALLVLKESVKLSQNGSVWKKTADIDGDGVVTSDDALRILQNIVGLAWDWRC